MKGPFLLGVFSETSFPKKTPSHVSLSVIGLGHTGDCRDLYSIQAMLQKIRQFLADFQYKCILNSPKDYNAVAYEEGEEEKSIRKQYPWRSVLYCSVFLVSLPLIVILVFNSGMLDYINHSNPKFLPDSTYKHLKHRNLRVR